MKKTLDSLAALANEADAEGNIRVADQIDGLIKVLAAYYSEEMMDDEQHAREMREAREARALEMHMGPEEIIGRSPEQKKADIAARHEKARAKMDEIAKIYLDESAPLPFKIPAPNTATGEDIKDFLTKAKDFLTKAGKPTNHRSWNELYSILDHLRGAALMWALGMGPNPFAGSGGTPTSPGATKSSASKELKLTKAAEESRSDKKQETIKMHERARVILKDIADMFKDAGQESPINVPPANITAAQILEALKLANMGAPLTGWSDLMKRLEGIKGQVALHLSTGAPSPFAGTVKPAPVPAPASDEIVRREGNTEPASIPTLRAVTGPVTLSSGGKGPPKAPPFK